MQKWKVLLLRYREPIRYVFFGGLTTLVNMAAYRVFFAYLGLPNVAATAIAWLLSVLFAFFTNKRWVFSGTDWKAGTLLREGSRFLLCRALTGALDILIMYIGVDVLNANPDLTKLLSNVIVILLNFVASKRMIFREK